MIRKFTHFITSFLTIVSLMAMVGWTNNAHAQSCPDGVSYQWTDILTIFDNAGCNQTFGCHGGGASGLDLTTYAGFSAGGNQCGGTITSGTLLTEIITVGASCGVDAVPAMTTFGATVTTADLDAIQAWIDSGALEDCPSATCPAYDAAAIDTQLLCGDGTVNITATETTGCAGGDDVTINYTVGGVAQAEINQACGDIALAVPIAHSTPGGCTPETITVDFTATCDGDGTEKASGTYDIEIWPALTDGIHFVLPVAECDYNIADLCGDLVILYDDGMGGPIVNTSPPVAATPMTINYTISFNGAPAACELSGSMLKNCDGCPAFDTSVADATAVCDGDVVTVSATETTGCFVIEIANENFDDGVCAGTGGTAPAGWVISHTGTGTLGSFFYFDEPAINGAAGGTATGTNGNFSGCVMAMDDDAPGSGLIGTGTIESPVYDLTPYPSANLTLDYEYNWIGADNFVIEVFDGTAWIPVLGPLVADETGALDVDVTPYLNANFQVRFVLNDGAAWAWGAAIDNFAITSTLIEGVTVDWTVNGVTQPQIMAACGDLELMATMTGDPNACAVETQTITYSAACDTDGSVVSSGSFDIDVWPTPIEGVHYTLPTADCDATIVDECAGALTIMYDDGAGGMTATPPVLNTGSGLSVNYSVVFTGAPASCTATGSYTAICIGAFTCPTFNGITADQPDACNGATVCYTVEMDGASDPLLLSEDFESGVQPPGWTVTPNDGTELPVDWGAASNSNPGGAEPGSFAGTSPFISDEGAANFTQTCIVSPIVDMSSTILPTLSASWQHEGFAGDGDFTIEVWNGAAWDVLLLAIDDSDSGEEDAAFVTGSDCVGATPAGGPVGDPDVFDISCYNNADFQVRFCYVNEDPTDAGGNWGASIDNVVIEQQAAANYGITWNTPVGATLVSGGTAEDLTSCYTLATNLTCGVDIQNAPITVDCVNNGVFDSNLFTGNTPNVSVYGIPAQGVDFELPSEECNSDIGNFCGAGLTILYDDGAGGPINSPTPPIIIGATAVNYIVQSTGAPAGCGVTGILNIPCGIPCPSYDVAVPDATNICDGETAVITVPELSGCLTQILAQENFDACVAPPGWVTTHSVGDPIANGDGDPYFVFDGTAVPGGAGANPNFSGCIAVLDDDQPSAALLGIGTLTAPAEDLTPFNSAFLSFDWGYTNIGADNFVVEVFDGTAWVLVLGPLAASGSGTENIDVSPYINGNFQVRFVLDDGGAWAWGVGIDNYMIEVSIVSDVTVNWNLDAVAQPSINQSCGDISLSTPLTMADPTGCVAEERVIDYRAFCDDDGSEIAAGNVSIFVYPTPVAGTHYTLPAGGCDATIADLCGSLEILYDDGAGGPVTNTTPPILVDGDALTINYSIAVPGAPANCTVTGSYESICITNLPCAVFNNLTADLTETCDGATVCYTVDLTDETQPILLSEDFESGVQPAGWTVTSNGTALPVNWASTGNPAGAGPLTGNSVLIDDTGAANPDQTCIVTPIVDMSSTILPTLSLNWQHEGFAGSGDFTIEVFNGAIWDVLLFAQDDSDSSEDDPDVSGGDCAGAFPTGGPVGDPDIFDLSCYSNADFQVRFCYIDEDNGGGNWGANVDNVLIEQSLPPNYTIAWSAPAGATLISGGGTQDQVTCYQLATTACGSEVQNAPIVVDCLDGNGAINGNLFTGNIPDVTVYSAPVEGADFTLPSAECDATIIDNCGGALTILYDDGFGGPITNTNPPLLTTPSAVNYIVMVTGAPAGCEATGVMNIPCGSNCPGYNPATIDNLIVCDGATVNVTATETSGCLSVTVVDENFDDGICAGTGGTAPAGWTVDFNAVAGAELGNFFYFDEPAANGAAGTSDTGDNPNFAGCIAALDDDAPGAGLVGVGIMTTDTYNLSNFSSANMTFDYEYNNIGADQFYVEVFDGTAWVQVLGPLTADATASANIDLTPYQNAAFQTRFVLDDGGAWAWGAAIDNFMIEATSISTVTVDWDVDGTAQPPITSQACGDVALAYTIAMADPNGCAAETQTISYTITCDEEATILDQGTFDVEVWPNPVEGVHYTLSTTACDGTITDLCGGGALAIFYGDGMGGPVNNPTPPTITASTLVDYSIKFTNDASGCSGVIGSYQVSCNACPTYDPPAIDVTEICTGESVNITATENTGCQTTFAAYTLPLTGTTNQVADWSPLTGRPNVGGTTLSANNPPYTLIPLQVDVTGTYVINSAFDFDGYLLLYTDPLDLTLNPPTTYVAGDDDGPNGTADAEVSVTLNAFQNYYIIVTAFGTASGNYTVTFPTIPAGAQIGQGAILGDDVTVNWTIDGVAQTPFTQVCGDIDWSPTLDMTDPNACMPETQTIAYSATCDGDGSEVSTGSFDVTLYPTPVAGVHFTLPTADCDATIVDECAGALTILYDDGAGGPITNATPPVVVQGTSLTINYTVVYTGAPVECTTAGSYEAVCIGNFMCPTFNGVTADVTEACDGTVVCYNVDMDGEAQPILLSEDFESGVQPIGWTVTPNDGTGLPVNWASTANPGGAGPLTGTSVLIDDTGAANFVQTCVVSPIVDLSSATSPTLSLNWQHEGFVADGDFTIEVWNGVSWDVLLLALDDSDSSEDDPDVSGTDCTGALPIGGPVGDPDVFDISCYSNADFQVRFCYVNENMADDGGNWGASIDNVVIEQLALTNFDVAWSTPPGATLVSGGGVDDLTTCYALSTALTCGSEVQNAPIVVNCSNNGTFDSELFNGNVPDVTLYGIPIEGTDFVLPTAECDATIVNNCGATILYDDGAGGPIVNTTPPTINGPTQVNYIVQSAGAPATCGATGLLNIPCGIPCPNYDVPLAGTAVCDGDATAVTVTELSGCLEVIVGEENFDACALPAGWTATHSAGDPLVEGDGDPYFNFAATTVPGGAGINPNFSGCIGLLDEDAPSAALVGVGTLTAPAADLTPFNSASLSFDWGYNNIGADNFTVEVFDGTAWVPVLGTLIEDGFGTENIDVSPYINASFQVRFVLDDGAAWGWGAGIDNYQLVGSSVSDVTVDWSLNGVAQPTINQGCGDVNFDVTWAHSDPTACTSETQTIDYTITCDEDANAQIAMGSYSIEVWPTLTQDVHYTIPTGCDATITDLCAGALTILYDDGAGGSIVNTTPPALAPPATIAYSINFTGAPAGCEVTGTITTADIIATATSNSPICEGEDLVLMETGGAGTNWTWSSDGAATFDDNTLQNPTASGAVDGETFTVVVTDDTGCSATSTVTITVSPLPIVSINAAGPFCAEDTPVLLVGNPAGGTFGGGAYVDAAGNFDPSLAIIGMNPVTYSVTQNGCTVEDMIMIEVNQVTAVAALDGNASCDEANGSATVVPAGGTVATDYSYIWDNGETTATAAMLLAGVHTVTVTDDAGCSATASVTIGGTPDVLIDNVVSTDATCGGSDGTATVTASGGTVVADYTYLWSDNQTTATASNLSSGSYTVTVTDDNGCFATASIGVSDAGAPTVDNITSTDATCGAADGTASVTASGGTVAADYGYQWDDPATQTTATATGLTAGTYNVTVTDDLGCIAIDMVEVLDIPGPSIDGIATTTGTCGDPTGIAVVTASGGTVATDYSYAWDNGATTAAITDLAAGTYTVTVTDDNGCTTTGSVVVDNTAGPAIDNISGTDTACGDASGTATVTASGGTPAYTYQWDDPLAQTTVTAVGLLAGTYNVTVTDNIGCTATAEVTLTDSPGPALTTSAMDATCGNANGTATVSATGGLAPYTYLWDAATGNQTTATATGLVAGTYSVLVSDDNGCQISEMITVGDIAGPTAAAVATDANCGNADGSATATVTGGTIVTDYTYQWDANAGNQTTATATGLAAGTYSVTITDDNNCPAETTVTVGDTPGPVVDSATSTDATCGGSDGTATVVASGGTAAVDYTYLWDDASAQTTATATGLSAGTYNVTVTDDNGCTVTGNVAVNDLGAPSIANTSSTDAICGGSQGTATVAATGGTVAVDYTYLWDDAVAQTTATATGLIAGTYNVTVTDDIGCSVIGSVTVADIAGPTVNNTFASDANCGASDGSATVIASGGTVAGSYSYQWDDPATQTTATASGLSAGIYNVTVTDDNGCIAIGSATVGGTDAPTIDETSSVDATCGDSDGSASVVAIGGTPGYTYQWGDASAQTTATATGLSAGTYTVTVTDANACVATASATVSDSGAPSIDNVNFTDASCGQADGSVTLTVSGGTVAADYIYQWDDPAAQTTATATGLAAGTYIVTVTDDLGCNAITAVVIGEETCIFIGVSNSFSADDPCTCNGDQSANGAGDGTFNETITVTGPPNVIVQASAASTGLDIPVPAAFIEVAPGRYELTFNHIDRIGYNLAVEFSGDGGLTFDNALNGAGLQLTFSNVCAYPVLDFVPLDMAYCGNDAAVEVNVLEVSTDVTFTAVANEPTISIDNGIAGPPPITFNPSALTTGFHNVDATYDYVAGTGMGGTLASPAIAINSCPVTYTEIVQIYDLPSATVTCTETGIISLDNITVPSGNLNDLMYALDGGAFGTSTSFTVPDDGTYTVNIMDTNTGCIVDVTANCLLPLELTSFKGECAGGDYALAWTTNTESNISHFVIERSVDATNYTRIGEVQAVGNSNTVQYYTFTDQTSLLARYYYRLRIVELDGLETFSGVVVAECLNGEFGVVDVYPNPTDSEVIITYEMTDRKDVVFRLVDVLGRTLHEEVLAPEIGVNTKVIDMAHLPSAMYFIILDDGKLQSTKKVVRK